MLSKTLLGNRLSFLPKNSDSRAKGTEFSAKAIRKAIETLDTLLGRSNVDALIYDLELYGLLAANERLFTTDQVQTALERIFGTEATPLLFERVKKALLDNTR